VGRENNRAAREQIAPRICSASVPLAIFFDIGRSAKSGRDAGATKKHERPWKPGASAVHRPFNNNLAQYKTDLKCPRVYLYLPSVLEGGPPLIHKFFALSRHRFSIAIKLRLRDTVVAHHSFAFSCLRYDEQFTMTGTLTKV